MPLRAIYLPEWSFFKVIFIYKAKNFPIHKIIYDRKSILEDRQEYEKYFSKNVIDNL